MIVFGCIVTFFGHKFFPWTIAILGCIIGFIVTMLLLQLFTMLDAVNLKGTQGMWLTSLGVFVSLIIGVFLGFVLMRMLKIGAMVLGATGGFFIGVTFDQLFFSEMKNIYITLTLTIGFAALVAFLAFKFYDHIVILTTALIGSYSLIRGLSIFIGKFPPETYLLSQIDEGDKIDVEYYFWIYFAFIVVFFFVGSVFQFKQRVTFNPDQY